MNRKMTALVIGNGDYPGAELPNPTNDAEDFSNVLEKFGFSIITASDCEIEYVERLMKSFKDSLNSNDVGLFYFAGHGMQIEGENYITAINTNFADEISAKYSSFPLNRLIEIMEKAENKTNIIILDACRNNPYERAWKRTPVMRGLAPVYTPRGTIIAFATAPGETAGDGKRRNGAYTDSLLRHIGTPDISIEEMFKRVRNTLSITTKNKQTSWEHTSLTGDFVFNISLGSQIDKYSKDAMSDGQFFVDTSKRGHSVIEALKSHNWYAQNPAINAFRGQEIEGSDLNTLFVIGRNVYQAACGSSGGANDFIDSFREISAGISGDKTAAMIDGMLFEIFFDPQCEIRENFKISCFNKIFELQKYPEFSPSFEFIAECLISHQNRFYVIPGKDKQVTIDVVSSENEKDECVIEQICFAGSNILQKSDDYEFYAENGIVPYSPKRISAFSDMISEETVIPLRLLSINIECESDKILYPYGFKISK